MPGISLKGVVSLSIFISKLLRECGIIDEVSLLKERPFDVFARATSHVDGKRCIFISDKKYLNKIDSTVSMVITTESIAKLVGEDADIGVCVSDNPRGLFFELMSAYEKGEGLEKFETRIGKDCKISKTAVISPYNVIIGDNVQIGDYVVIHPNTTIGNHVTIQAGAKIAEQDFNVYSYHGIKKQVYHSGNVVIGSNVLISSGVFIGQAMYLYGETLIGDNCFIGANVCVGHNAEIQSGCEVCANSIIAGYCRIGENTKIFLSVTLANAINIGKKVTINVGSVVIRDVPDGKTVFGNPAREIIAP